MSPKTAPPILSSEEVIQRLGDLRSGKESPYYAFYSSHIGGIVTDPALIVIPFDDHMVHRGHGIFDTAGLKNGKMYDLDAHLDRFLRSAENSKLRPEISREEMREIIIQTTAASGKRDGSIRYWLSSGVGNLGLVPAAEEKHGFFVMIFAGLQYPEAYYTEGMKVITTTYPIKPPLYARTKSTNYLPNVLMQMEAKEKGTDNGVFLDANGNIGEGSNMNVAFTTKEQVLIHPKFDNILTGCTSQRLLSLAPALVDTGVIKGIELRDIPVEEGRGAAEMMLIGSGIKVAPVVQWDGKPIGDGKPGPVTKAMANLLEQDMLSGEGVLIDVPY